MSIESAAGEVSMKFALVPWKEEELKDSIFYQNSDGKNIQAENVVSQMKREFERLGHEIHTYDMYPNWNVVDYFLLFPIEWVAAEKIERAGFGNRLIYCNAEPPTVCALHTREGYAILRQIFPCILTWNPALVDGNQIFKRCIPYYFSFHPCRVPFEQRKLLTGISANKHSEYSEQLYTERETAYRFFEENYPDQFDFYGVLWNKDGHPCYKGTVENKYDVFHQYKFAICYENTRTEQDYITEKIWDCLTAQIVPIYMGAANIRDYIPENCFIDREQFSSYSELADYLLNMSEDEYNRYLNAAQKLLKSDALQNFSAVKYVHDILYAADHAAKSQMTAYGRQFLKEKASREKKNIFRANVHSKIKRILKM